MFLFTDCTKRHTMAFVITLVVPCIVENERSADVLAECRNTLKRNQGDQSTEFIFIDNGSLGSGVSALAESDRVIRNATNYGVLHTFKQGYEAATGDVIAFIHSDVLIHEPNWDLKMQAAFARDPKLGLAGLFGGKGLHPGGGRENCFSNMRGLKWGKCGCHDPAGLHHGKITTEITPCVMFDGVGLFFRKSVLKHLVEETDAFAAWRAPHHFYDRILSLKVAAAGWRLAVLPLAFDHLCGATAGMSKVYKASALEWLTERGHKLKEGQIPDQAIYNVAEAQFFAEWSERLPLRVDEEYRYRWGG